MRSPVSRTSVVFAPEPYTFRDVRGYQKVWSAPERKCCGVYLWCIEYRGAYLVNYVGKTTGKYGFDGRLWKELKDWRAGLCWRPVDVEAWKVGRRVLLQDAPPNQLARQLAEFEPLYRILLAPITEASDCFRVENEIVHRLRANDAVFQFLCNGDKDWAKYPHEPTVEISATGNPPIIGLTAPIPQSLL